jgi:mono/diheme cytochrome c family protein
MITGSFGLAESYHKKKAIPKEGVMEIASNDGESLYKANCVVCHGNDGKLGLSGAKDLSTSMITLAEVKEIILQGKGLMPPAQVNPEQADAIAEYIQTTIKAH